MRGLPSPAACRERLAALRPEERETAVLVARGLTDRGIAARTVVHPKTVAYRIARARAKVGVATRVELAVLAALAEVA